MTLSLVHVDTRPHKQLVDAVVTTTAGRHRIGHLPTEGWFCSCSRPRACPHIATVQQLVPTLNPPTEGAQP